MKNNIKPLTNYELYNILDSIDDAIFIDSANGSVVWINEACEDLFQISKDSIIGRNIDDLEEEGIFRPSVARQVIESKQQIDIIHENKAGKKILSTGTPILNEANSVSYVITTSRDITQLIEMREELEYAQSTLASLKDKHYEPRFFEGDIIANSQSMFHILKLVKRLASLDSTVLISGESGVGKGVVAKLLHDNGPRKDKPMVKVNCGAIPENLIESELFGYEGGAFTGSREKGKVGLFESANGGSIFLDEISELPLNLQVKLLQVIQDKEITRVGGVKSIPIDVRIISATNTDLYIAVTHGKFREDLYYRLNVVPIRVPPLRERSEDIVPLINHFLSISNKQMNENKTISDDALALLTGYDWPGNIRELQNIVERLIITSRNNLITPDNIPEYVHKTVKEKKHFRISDMNTNKFHLQSALEETEKRLLVEALDVYGSTRKMSKAMGISQPTVVRKLNKYGIKTI